MALIAIWLIHYSISIWIQFLMYLPINLLSSFGMVTIFNALAAGERKFYKRQENNTKRKMKKVKTLK